MTNIFILQIIPIKTVLKYEFLIHRNAEVSFVVSAGINQESTGIKVLNMKLLVERKKVIKYFFKKNKKKQYRYKVYKTWKEANNTYIDTTQNSKYLYLL